MTRLTQEEKIAQTRYLVEATSYEDMMHWVEWHKNRKVPWEQDSVGFFETIGYLDKRPVCVNIAWAIIAGQRVAFWHATSQVVDHEMIDAWLKKKFVKVYEPGRWVATSDSMNFGNIMRDIANTIGYVPWKVQEPEDELRKLRDLLTRARFYVVECRNKATFKGGATDTLADIDAALSRE